MKHPSDFCASRVCKSAFPLRTCTTCTLAQTGFGFPLEPPSVAAKVLPPADAGRRTFRSLKQKPETPEIRRLRREIRTTQFRGQRVADMAHLLMALTNQVRKLERKAADENTF